MIKKNIIFSVLILLIALSFYLLDKDINNYSKIIEAQQVEIDNLNKQLGYHDIRLSGQMDTLMVHRSRLEQIKIFLENMNLNYASKK
tara:strand:- start:660 stop:920 length:261 start_codon:yes stop_codon:yes gene_type:complete